MMSDAAFRSMLVSGQGFVKTGRDSYRPLTAGDNGRAIYTTRSSGDGYALVVPGVEVEPPIVPDPSAEPREMPSMTPPRRPRRPDGATPPQAAWPTWQERPREPEAPFTEQVAEVVMKGPGAVLGFFDTVAGGYLMFLIPWLIAAGVICALAACIACPPLGIGVLALVITLACCRKKKKVTS